VRIFAKLDRCHLKSTSFAIPWTHFGSRYAFHGALCAIRQQTLLCWQNRLFQKRVCFGRWAYIAKVSDRLADTVTGKSEELINRAMEVIGVRYRWGSELPQSGLDGSSFVGYVFKDKLGFLLPRKSTQMSRVGKPISREELQPGDLVFFNTMRLTFSHVGIYVGDNKFIHSPSKGTECSCRRPWKLVLG
jgi:cell wall-associated NlpC family hydrolase